MRVKHLRYNLHGIKLIQFYYITTWQILIYHTPKDRTRVITTSVYNTNTWSVLVMCEHVVADWSGISGVCYPV